MFLIKTSIQNQPCAWLTCVLASFPESKTSKQTHKTSGKFDWLYMYVLCIIVPKCQIFKLLIICQRLLCNCSMFTGCIVHVKVRKKVIAGKNFGFKHQHHIDNYKVKYYDWFILTQGQQGRYNTNSGCLHKFLWEIAFYAIIFLKFLNIISIFFSPCISRRTEHLASL